MRYRWKVFLDGAEQKDTVVAATLFGATAAVSLIWTKQVNNGARIELVKVASIVDPK